MEIKDFKDELNKLGIDDSETKTAKIINVIYDTRDPVLLEMISTSNINDFISTYLQNTLVELKSSPKDFDTIFKSSSKRVEKVKAESKTYIAKKIEIENKEKNEQKIWQNDEIRAEEIKKEVEENIEEYRSLKKEERAKRNADNFRDKLGYKENEIKGIEQFSIFIEDLYDLVSNLTPENVEKAKKILQQVKSIPLDSQENKAIKAIIENLGIDIQQLSLEKGKEQEVEEASGMILDTFTILNSLIGKGYTVEDVEILFSDESFLDSLKKMDKSNCLKMFDILERQNITYKKMKYERANANDYKSEKMQGPEPPAQEDLAQMDEARREEETVLPDLSADDFFSMADSIFLQYDISNEDKEESQPITNKEGDQVVAEHGVELDDSGIIDLEKYDYKTSGIDTKEDDKMFVDNTYNPIMPEDDNKDITAIEAEEILTDSIKDINQEVEKAPEIEVEEQQNQLAVYKPRFADRFKSFVNDIKNMGLINSFSKNFMSNDVQMPVSETKANKEDGQLKGVVTQEQNNIAQEENVKKQTLLTKMKDSLKKAFGVKDETAEKIVQDNEGKIETSDSKDSKGGFDFSSPDEELMAKTTAVGKEAGAKLNDNKDKKAMSTAKSGIEIEERDD